MKERRFILTIALLWAALGAVSFLGFEAPEFRAWEQLYDHEAQRFAPERQVSMREIGDLGYKTWNRALQFPRDTIFTTDRWGYRNPSDLAAPEIVVIGDSYVAGAGLSDGETAPMRLAKRLGVSVYNFAGEELNAPAYFLRDERFMRQRPKVLIWAPVARGIAARPLFYEGSEPAAPSFADRVLDWGQTLEDAALRLNRDNGLAREARFALQGLLGTWRDDPRLRQLANGDAVLAPSLREQNLLTTPEQRRVDSCIQMVTIFAGILDRAGVRFVFSPIPEPGTIYPELFDATARPPTFLDRLLAGVRAQGVEVVDLRDVYRQTPTPYLYLPDDSHWNPRAADLAAEAWAAALVEPPPRALAARVSRQTGQP